MRRRVRKRVRLMSNYTRPLKDRTDDEIFELVRKAKKIYESVYDNFNLGSYGYGDCMLNGLDIQRIRGGLLCMMKLCDMYGIPYEKPDENSFNVGNGERDEEVVFQFLDVDDMVDEPFEMMDGPLGYYLEKFTELSGVGDFVEEVGCCETADNYVDILDDEDAGRFKELARGTVEEVEEAKKLLYGDESAWKYQSFRDYCDVLMEYGADECECFAYTVTKSKGMRRLEKAIKDRTVTDERVVDLLTYANRCLMNRRCYSDYGGNHETDEETDEEVYISYNVFFYESCVRTCPLYTYSDTLVIAYAIQEIIERYAPEATVA